MLTEGQASDKATAPDLIAPLALTGDVVADRGYFGRAVIEAIEAKGATAHVPSQSNVREVRSVDPAIYRDRNRIERFFNRLKHFRGIAPRYNKLARNFLAAVMLASVRIWLKIMSSRPIVAIRRLKIPGAETERSGGRLPCSVRRGPFGVGTDRQRR